ncbi:MAG: tetratricopeptide repeat protein, partial [Candidatus Electrothrix sp. AR1]|nr:tetratricopeptide repeat protein [Candidatus Electrothrix sp. AR1]
MDQIKKIFSGEWWKWVFSGVGPWIIRTVGVVQRDQSNFTVKNGFTKEQYKKILEEQRQTIIEEVRVAAGNEEKLKLLDEKYSDIQNKLADLQKSYEERKKLLKQASEDLERIKGNLSDSQLTEAEEKLEKGETKAAEQAFDAVVDQGAGAVSLAAFRSGTLSEDRLDYEKTFRQYKKAAVLEEDNPEYLLAAGKMAQTLADYRQAQDWLEQLLKIREAEKKEDTHLASALYNLAWVYTFQGCYDKAEPLYKRTRAIFEKNLGKDHNEVVTTLNNLAGLYIKQGRYDDAKPLYRRTLAILKKTLGKDHHE